MSALHQLSGVMETVERYGEAETMAREVLPWMQGHEMLGGNSPQALGLHEGGRGGRTRREDEEGGRGGRRGQRPVRNIVQYIR
jgi:hypothetical protein